MIIAIMGVSGSGKSTIGTMLAADLGCAYLEGDALHPPENVAHMHAGRPLTDEMRQPWLAAVRTEMVRAADAGQDLVVGCSALRASYRTFLDDGLDVAWVYLRGPADVIEARLSKRTGHFFGAELLGSQFAVLEEPVDAIVADVRLPPDAIVQELLVRVSRARDVRVFPTLDAMSMNAAHDLASVLRTTVERTGRCSLVLSGGSTPRGLHRALAAHHRDDVPWHAVHVFWSDERYVPRDDPRSNAGMAFDTLLAHVPCPAANIFTMPTSAPDPDAAACAYENTLLEFFGGMCPSFDVAILGVGEDGHTASLFPHAPGLAERSRLVTAVQRDDVEPPLRLTLTMPVLLTAARTWVLVDGARKADAVQRSLDPGTNAGDVPAASLQQARGSVTWWLDEPAASRLHGTQLRRNEWR